MLAPYREFVDRSPSVKLQKTGLILVPIPHRCNPPGKFRRFINRIFGKQIIPGALWRCKECLNIRQFCGETPTHYPGWANEAGLVQRRESLPEGTTLLQRWIDAGGEE